MHDRYEGESHDQHALVVTVIDADGVSPYTLDADDQLRPASVTVDRHRLRIDTVRRCLVVDDRHYVPMPRKQRGILAAMMTDPRRCWTRRELDQLTSGGYAPHSRSIDQHLARIRAALAVLDVTAIHNTYGEGWQLTTDD